MNEVVINAILETLKIVPFLFIIYVLIEIFEYKYGESMKDIVQKAGKSGPGIGAVLGSLPQCGFSVISTALYSQRFLTIGTLIAVYLATSDEAIPIILANPKLAGYVLPIILTKIVIAVISGYAIDSFYKRYNRRVLKHIHEIGPDDVCDEHHLKHEIDEIACCGHNPDEPKGKELILHPLIHTLKISLFIFLITLAINIFFFKAGDGLINKIFLNKSIFQPVVAALIGLVPNCAASVAISELFVKGVFSYGSLIAGLSSSAGLGLLILFKEEKDKRRIFLIIGILFGISILSGVLIQLFWG